MSRSEESQASTPDPEKNSSKEESRRKFLKSSTVAAATGLAAGAAAVGAAGQDVTRPIRPILADSGSELMVKSSQTQLQSVRLSQIRDSHNDVIKGSILREGLNLARTFGGDAAAVSFGLSFGLSW